MKTVRVTLLSMAMLVGVAFWGMAVYTEEALAGRVPSDGYGISAVTMR